MFKHLVLFTPRIPTRNHVDLVITKAFNKWTKSHDQILHYPIQCASIVTHVYIFTFQARCSKNWVRIGLESKEEGTHILFRNFPKGKSLKEIGLILNRFIDTVKSFVYRYNQTKKYIFKSEPRNGRPFILS